MTDNNIDWVPKCNPRLEVGPSRWTGTKIVATVGITGEERLIEIGLLERCVLDEIDGARNVSAITSELSNKGLPVDDTRVMAILNRFAFVGAVERPFKIRSGTTDVDRAAHDRMRIQSDQIAAIKDSGKGLDLWRKLQFLASPIFFRVLIAAGIAASVFLAVNIPRALLLLMESSTSRLVPAVLVALTWTVTVTMIHESGHGALFYYHSKRFPFFSLVRFGPIPMPNTYMPGISLLETVQRVRVIAAGPLVSMVLAAIPVGVFIGVNQPIIQTVAAMCMMFDAVVIALGISLFPNTDATRLLEALGGVDQIQVVSFRTLIGKYRLPTALPVRSRVAIRFYPFLLMVSTLGWILMIVSVVMFMWN
ncbi:hypothetical protein [Devriesea agamarum]|uniref:hypothetical protein n=1 Tax=Devriesea agamarum TaxID=472569 RepID=UPI00071C3387|nr:hypothetical protein [Devriesea agamarum]